MPKPTVKSSHLGPWTPENREQLIDKLVEVAGELPAQRFEIIKLVKGEIVTQSGSARERLRSELESAYFLYRSADDGRRQGTAKQLLNELRRIESAAHRLLMLVGDDAAAVRSPFGLHHGVDDEDWRLRQALRQAGLTTLRRLLPRARLGTAIEGVEALRRWAKAAAEENLRRATKMRAGKIGLGHARHKGDVPLNQYIETVVQECWCGVWGRQISDGPKLWRFVVIAAADVGVGLSDAASRERIRRIFGLRRANQRGLNSDLPRLGTTKGGAPALK